MANSDATITRVNLIRRAFRRIGMFNPTVTDIANSVGLLNDIIKELDVEGKWLWAISNTVSTLSLVASTRSYSVATPPTGIEDNILKLETFELVIGTTFRPLRIIDKEESVSTMLRENTGEPTLVYLETKTDMTLQKIHVFQTPASSYTAQYTYRRRLYDFDNPSDNPDFPQDWNLKLTKLLCAELAHEYGLPLEERALLEQIAEKEKQDGLAAVAKQAAPASVKTTYY